MWCWRVIFDGPTISVDIRGNNQSQLVIFMDAPEYHPLALGYLDSYSD